MKSSENKRNNNKGITLIALVITIIVLLILAAVSIATLTGENGLLTKATMAKKNTEIEEVIEKAKLDIAGEFTEDNLSLSDEQLINILKKYFEDVPNTLPDDLSTIKLTTKEEYGNHEITISEIWNKKNNEDVGKLAESIDETNYGDYIDYNVDLEIDGNQDGDTTDIDDWRIFYKDEQGNIFIIASDYVPTTKLNNTGMGMSGTYNVNFNDFSTVNINENVANLFKFGFDYSNSMSNQNMAMVTQLLDTTKWSDFATGIDGAIAIGAPTLEMYVASWNAKGYTPLYCNNATNGGYYIGINSEPTTNSVDMISANGGIVDNLYCPHTNDVNGCRGYWLAAPSNWFGNIFVMNVTDIGYIGEGYEYVRNDIGVRPVVCIPAGTKGELIESGIWNIAEE